jgi:DNA polymerase delta subunit 4
MPTTRRSSGGRGVVASGKQSKLSFNNRITKSVPKSVKDSAPSPLKKEIIQEKVERETVEDIKTEEQSEQEPEQPISKPDITRSDAERKAEKISDAAIQKYWRRLELERIAKRVHQEDLTTGEKVLRYFDVSSQYGVRLVLLLHAMCSPY